MGTRTKERNASAIPEGRAYLEGSFSGQRNGDVRQAAYRVQESVMKGLADEKWLRLSVACINVRDDLRKIVFEIDRALRKSTGNDAELLQKFRVLAARHADSLKAALKHPQ